MKTISFYRLCCYDGVLLVLLLFMPVNNNIRLFCTSISTMIVSCLCDYSTFQIILICIQSWWQLMCQVTSDAFLIFPLEGSVWSSYYMLIRICYRPHHYMQYALYVVGLICLIFTCSLKMHIKYSVLFFFKKNIVMVQFLN